MAALQFAPWTSEVELAFYASLANLKINHDRLDDSARKVLGLYELRPLDPPERSGRMQIHGNALTTDDLPVNYYRAEGILKNVNTIEEYRKLDRAELVEKTGRTIWDAINDGTIFSCPSLLNAFQIISYADLKKYKFSYHFCFPAIHSDPSWKLVGASSDSSNVAQRLPPKDTQQLVEAVQTWKYSTKDDRQYGFFLAKRVRGDRSDMQDQSEPMTPGTPALEWLGFQWVVGSLRDYENGFFNGTAHEDRFVAFTDPSTFAANPGWPLRNLLVLIRQRWRLDEVQILCYRDTNSRRDQSNSIILNLQSAATTIKEQAPASVQGGSHSSTSPPMPKVTGWERADNGKLTSKMVDLAEYMDPQRLADQAVDLNLKLIKWRIAPNIDLDVIKNTKCLLLGAGTLGSYVSRNLMGWGVRRITFIDNATVSFSNPVRQPLFDFKDCLEGGTKKAWRAAEALTEIYPGVTSEGHVMSVPMAGHPIIDETKVKGDFDKLKKLIDEHDAIFLLMDTRESRWLPTVMGKAAGKIVLNAALGFDTFVVMRHGIKQGADGKGEEVGCYFCNDVVAPADSLKDATLDQQCTVTRPGIAPIASALLVELLVSILQHPLKALAPSTTHDATNKPSRSLSSAAPHKDAPHEDTFVHPLGTTPHQLRGFLSQFNTLSISGKPYDCCSACSDGIVERYKKDGWEFVKRALNEKGWVEEVSGLKEVQRRAEEAMEAEEWSEEDGGSEGEGELI